MESQDPDMGVWRPLPRILYGFAIFPFSPVEDESQPNPHQVPLEIGSELYVFEVFRPSRDISYSDEGSLWYRGYVVASKQATSALASVGDSTDSADNPAPQDQPGVDEPSVTVGIFPATHCLIKERLEDTDARLEEVRQAADITSLETGLGRRQKAQLATLLEEDESQDEDLLSGIVNNLQTPSKARNRASLVDGRLSGHKRSESSSSLAEQIAGPSLGVEDRPPPPLPSLKTGDETAAGLDEPLVDEIACSLRGSANLLYTHLYQRNYSKFHEVKAAIDDLHLGRRQLLNGTLSTDELQRLRQSLVDKLVLVNISQGLDIVVRHPQWGALADVEAHEAVDERAWMSAVRMYKLGVELAYTDPKTGKRPLGSHSILGPSTEFPRPAQRTAGKQHQQNTASHASELSTFYHVLVDLKAFVASPCAPGETAELIFSLYNKSEKRFLTEECCIVVNHQGVPRDGRLDRARTLFKDLSQQDVLDTLVLVCRIVINGHLKPFHIASNGRSSSSTSNSPYGFQPPPSSASFVSPALQSAISFADQQELSPKANRESMLSNPNDSRRSFRRPFGCAVVDVSQLCKIGQVSAQYSELSMPIFTPINEANFSTLHEDILASRIKEFEKSVKADHVSIGLRFFHEDVKAIARDHPSLMIDTALTPRLGFPDVIMPDDQRNHIYVKLWTGDFPSLNTSGGKLRSANAANVEVEMEVRTRNGSPISFAISRGSGEPNVTRFTSTVLRNSMAPTWGELCKVDLPPEDMRQSHLFFTFRNRKDRMAGSALNSGSSYDKPFAFGYLPLFAGDDTCLSDGMHQIHLYRHDPQWCIPSTYLDVPCIEQEAEEVASDATARKMLVPLRDSFSIRTFLCSTQLTQDPTLLRIMDWEKKIPNNAEALKAEFSRLKYCPEFECIKMIRHIFDALFAILASQRNEHGEVDGPAFSVLVNLLSLVNDRRFEHFRPILDVYIERHFTSSTAFSHIVKSLNHLVGNFGQPDAAQDLRASIKVWPYLFKLIMRSRKMQRAKEEDMNVTANHIETAFKRDLMNLLQAINVMMSATAPPSVIGTQGLAVQHFAGIIPEMLECFSNEEMTDIVVAFCDAITASRGAIVVNKILLQGHLIRSPLFENASARAILVPNICRWIRPHLGKIDDFQAFSPRDSTSAREASRVSWQECVRLSVAVVAALADRLHASLVDPMITAKPDLLAQEHDSIEYVLSLLPRLSESYHEAGLPETRQLLLRHRSAQTAVQKEPTVFPATHPAPLLLDPPPSTTTLSLADTAPIVAVRGEASSAIIVLIHIAPVHILSNYLQSSLEIEGFTNFSRFLANLLRTCCSFLRYEAFPSTWLNISMLAHKSIAKIAKPIANVMQQYLIPEKNDAASFDLGIWKGFFDMMLNLLASPSLVIEEFSPARQRAVWRLAGDIRGEGSKILLHAWEALSWPEHARQNGTGITSGIGGYQAGLGSLVDPVLELCLSHHDELRNSAVQILYSLLVTEYHLSGNFSAIESEVLDRLDKLFSQKKGDEISRSFFITQLRTLFEASDMDEGLRDHVQAFLESVNHFLELLLGIRNLPEGEEWQDDRVIGTLRLMAFIEKRHRAIFVRYVHRLVDFHLASNQFTEAGLTLKLHADLYSFNPASVALAIPDLNFAEQSEFNRKELLYLRILELLSRGQAYETAIAISKELQQQYEQYVFAYQRLSELFTHQADLFASIVNRTRSFPHHFRVGFYGRGFPVGAQNKQFVYRAYEWEKFGSFCERMQVKHPQAQLMRGHDVPSLDLQNSDGRFLLITPVSPEPDQNNIILQNPDVLPAIRNYYEHNETRVFTCTRVMERSEHSLTESANSISNWTEKTFLYCAEAFPTILKRTEVLDVQVIEVSPLESALNDVKAKTAELDSHYRRYQPLATEAINGDHGSQMDTNPLSMALNNAVDTGISGGIPLYRRAFFDSSFIAANTDKLDMVEELRLAVDEQVRLIAKALQLHSKLCPPDMESFHSTLIKFFERNFAPEIARLGSELEYQASNELSPQHSASTSPETLNGILGASANNSAGHRRNLSTSTITSSNTHLPFALPSMSGFQDGTPLAHQNAVTHHKSALEIASISPTNYSPEQPLRSPRSKLTIRSDRPHVNFALPDSGKNSGRASPTPSNVPSTIANGSTASDRPTSFLSRLSSIRKKRF